jgi:hypothetical protein
MVDAQNRLVETTAAQLIEQPGALKSLRAN